MSANFFLHSMRNDIDLLRLDALKFDFRLVSILQAIKLIAPKAAVGDCPFLAAPRQIAILNMSGSNAKYNGHIILQYTLRAT